MIVTLKCDRTTCQYVSVGMSVRLLISQIPEISDYKDIQERILCGFENHDCRLKSFHNWPSIANLKC